jgi:class 3 adenylate cyclase
MSTIAEWPVSVGMSECTQRFAENNIDFDILGELTHHDFDRLGMSVGHRGRMLRTIRARGGPSLASAEAAAASPVPQDGAERHQLTVMFCDFVGSTALSGKLNPEDLRGVIGAYHRCCSELIERNGGFVAKYVGDRVLAYFGYP